MTISTFTVLAQDTYGAFVVTDSSGRMRWGCMNHTTSDTILPAIYDKVRWDKEYGAIYRLGENTGLLDKRCKVIFSIEKYRYINRFYLGEKWYWRTNDTNAVYGLWTSDYQPVLPLEYRVIKPLNHLIIAVQKDSLFGVMNADFELIVPYQYDYIHKLEQGYAKTILGDKVGVIAPDGRVLIEPTYCSRGSLKENRLAVYKADLWGYLDSTGKVSIPLQYKWAEDFHWGYARVVYEREKAHPQKRGNNLERLFGMIDLEGNWVLPPIYKYLSWDHKKQIQTTDTRDERATHDSKALQPLPNYHLSNKVVEGLGAKRT